jgi:ribosome-binding protein aMBF1 (putative translation factor)
MRCGARDGRLHVDLSTRSAFGRPIRFTTRAAVDAFVKWHYRQRYSRFAPRVAAPLIPTVPSNFASRIIGVRVRLCLSQAELARRIGAANKAVIYQWESHKRTPSVVFWSRIERLTCSESPASGCRRVAEEMAKPS